MLDRREKILRAAVEVAKAYGMGALSVRTVAAKAGIGPSTLRHYFPSQRDLYEEVIGVVFHQHLDDLRIHDTGVPASQRLMECLQQFLPADDSKVPELEHWLAGYSLALGPERTEQGTRLLAVLSKHAQDRVSQWLAVLAAEGALRHSDNRRYTTVLLSLVNGVCLELITPNSLTDVVTAQSILEEIVEYVVTRGQTPDLL